MKAKSRQSHKAACRRMLCNIALSRLQARLRGRILAHRGARESGAAINHRSIRNRRACGTAEAPPR